jgi:hypothetical protein
VSLKFEGEDSLLIMELTVINDPLSYPHVYLMLLHLSTRVDRHGDKSHATLPRLKICILNYFWKNSYLKEASYGKYPKD